MKASGMHQEILMVSGTNFSTREFSESTDGINYDLLTEKEKLIVACWNGLLLEMFPEIFNDELVDKKLYLWGRSEGSLFMEVKLGEIDVESEKQFSIDPCSFLPARILT